MYVDRLLPWRDFYLLIGQAAATLTGLMFVGASIAAPKVNKDSGPLVHSFLSPTIQGFGVLVLLSACMLMPPHKRLGVAVFVISMAVAGCITAVRSAFRIRKTHGTSLPFKEWIWHVWLPLGTYLWTLIGAIGIRYGAEWWDECLAGSVIALLFLGVRNAWNVTLYFAMQD